jgi:haloalkane dehalogenase
MIAPKQPSDPGVAENRAAWRARAHFEKPFLTVFGDRDSLKGGNERLFQERVPGARGQPHAVLRGRGHYIQEDLGEEVAALVLRWIADLALTMRAT